VQLVAGHCRGTTPLELDWHALADPELTLVFYMGLANLEQIRDGLLGAGRPAATPVAVVENGTLATQRCLVTRLDAVLREVMASDVAPPAVVIVGDVVRLAAELDWYRPRDAAEPVRANAAGARRG
jgi:siroheme synthase